MEYRFGQSSFVVLLGTLSVQSSLIVFHWEIKCATISPLNVDYSTTKLSFDTHFSVYVLKVFLGC